MDAATRTISPTSPSSAGARSLRPAMWRRGTTRTGVGEESRPRFVTRHFRLQVRRVRIAKIRRVRHNQIGQSGNSVQKVRVNERDTVGYVVPGAVSVRDLKCRGGRVSCDHGRCGKLYREGDGKAAAP